MGDAALGSDHVNYLVLRYLQENGHESTARAFYKDWNRSDEFRDPERFPFASTVKQQELVNIIQDGLYHDQLQASVANRSRRFTFIGRDLPRIITSKRPAPKAPSRRPSTYEQPEQDDFPTPAPKRARKSNGSEVHINGDAMDVDKDSDNDGTNATEPERDQSDADNTIADEPPELITAATQTDGERKTRIDDRYFNFATSDDGPILDTLWCQNDRDPGRLLCIGETSCGTWHIPRAESKDDEEFLSSAVSLPEDAVVTASCWHPTLPMYACAVDEPGAEQKESWISFHPSQEDAQVDRSLAKRRLKAQGMTIVMRFSESGDYLLTVSTTGFKAYVQIWSMSQSAHRSSDEPAARKAFVGIILDAVWLSETSIAICGDRGIFIVSLEHTPDQSNGLPNGDATSKQRLESFKEEYHKLVPSGWDKVRFDRQNDVLVACSSTNNAHFTLAKKQGQWSDGPRFPRTADYNRTIIALAYQPLSNSDEMAKDQPRRLATAFDNGRVGVFNVSASSIEVVASLSIAENEPVLALSWAPHNDLLAIASDEAVRIWNMSTLKCIVSWQAAPALWYQRNDFNLPSDEDDHAEPSLSWDVYGRRLAFSVGKKTAVISLLDEAQDAEMNDAA